MEASLNKTDTFSVMSYTKREQYLTLVGVVMAWAFDAADYLLLTFLIKQIGKDFGFSQDTKAWLMGLQLLGTAIGGIIFGYLGDTIGRKKTLITVITIYSIFTALTAFAYSTAILFILRICTGIGVGGVWALGSSLINEIWPKERRNVGIAITQAGWPFGELLAALLVTFVVEPFDRQSHSLFNKPFHGWRFAFLFGGFAILTAVYIYFYVPESKAWLKQKELKKAGKEVENDLSLRVFKNLFAPDIRWTFALGLLFGITGMMAFYSINSWLPEYYQLNGLTLKDSALMIGIFWGTSGYIGHVLFGFVSNWIGRKPTFVIYTSLIVISGVVMYQWVQETWAKYLGLSLFTFGCGYFSSFGVVFGEIYPTKVRATAASISYNGARGMSLLAPIFVVWIGDIFNNMGAGLAAGGLFVVLSSIILFFLPTKEGQDIIAADN